MYINEDNNTPLAALVCLSENLKFRKTSNLEITPHECDSNYWDPHFFSNEGTIQISWSAYDEARHTFHVYQHLWERPALVI